MTAVEKAIERLTNLHLVIPTNTKENRNIKGVYVHCIMILKEHLEMEKQQSQDYAKFAINCDRKEMPILNFEDYIKL